MVKIPPVKGTRDFYPEQMARRNWILEGWRRASIRNGFVEYDGPIFEYLQLYTAKSGEEIASQLFSLTDRGGRDLALRPEITPTLARMVNQKINSLPRPIKWFSLPRLCRAERPQRGRLREFFQWNVDVIGSDSVLADAECIYTAVDYLRSIGLTAADVVVKISSRSLLAALLRDIGFADPGAPGLETIYALLDKRPKVTEDAFAQMAAETVPDKQLREKMMEIFKLSLQELASQASDSVEPPLKQLTELFGYLEMMGVKDYCTFDINIVRGLAYYTGCVYEIYDRKAPLRALCGGGRYDNLLAGLGGPNVPATGFGMGDVVLELMLAERNLLNRQDQKIDFFVMDADAKLPGLFDMVLEIVGRLRQQGCSAALGYKRTSLGKQLKQASEQKARFAVIVGREIEHSGQVTVKNLSNGNQKLLDKELFLTDTQQWLEANLP